MNEDTCGLCKEKKQLMDSHIIPKFVFKWMRKTGSQHLRVIANVNKREQDGPTRKLLCNECEQKFNKHETPFSKEFFHPILDDMVANNGLNTKLEYKYDESLFLFSLSFLWRALIVNLKSNDCPTEHIEILTQVEQEWRNFLDKDVFPRYWNEVHMIVLDKSGDFEGKPPKFDFYVMRSTDATVVHGEGQLYVFAKASRFIFIAPVIGFNDKSSFINTLINPIGGIYTFPQTIKDHRIGAFLVNRVKEINEYAKQLSENQRSKISEQVDKDKQRLFGSDLHRSLSDDLD